MNFPHRLVRAWELRRHRRRPPSPLLDLPLELRLEIWKYVIGGFNIAIYREPGPDRRRGKLTHGILDESNTQSPGHIFHVNNKNIQDTINQVYGLTGDDLFMPDDGDDSDGPDDVMATDLERPRPMSKRDLAALLKTCRSVYAETVELLYSCNFFVFLHNSALSDLHTMVPRTSFAQIRHLHLHETLGLSPPTEYSSISPGSNEQIQNFARLSGKILAQMQNIKHLSIFFWGNLTFGEACMRLSETINYIAQEAHPDFFMIRVPHPIDTEEEGLGVHVPDIYLDEDMPWLDANLSVQSCKAPRWVGRHRRGYDYSMGPETNWQVGSWFSKDGTERNESNEYNFVITDYAVFTKNHQRELKREIFFRYLRRANVVGRLIRNLRWRIYWRLERAGFITHHYNSSWSD